MNTQYGGSVTRDATVSVLPHEFNRFVGRERELNELRALRTHTRLLALTGPGGVGKTRLALHLVADVSAEFSDGIAYVDVAPIDSADVLVAVVGASVGARSAAGLDDLAEALGERQLLLLLDNCGGLVAACAEVAMALLSHCRGLQIIATSTERLGIPGEALWQVPPLRVPEPGASFETVVASEAVQLLVDRVVEINPHFVLDESSATHLAEIARRLDGLPLALELAAGWITTLSVAEIAERLDDALGLLTRGVRGAPARQQTLRATLDLITARLTDAERRLFARVGVFNGSWNLDAARAVCADDIIPAPHVLPILAELVGKSLVQVAPSGRSAARYRLLEVIRQYALELLASAGELGTMRQRHAAWCQDLVGAMPVGAGSSDELQSLLYEHDNLRAALSWAIAEKDADLGLGLATRLHGVWYMQGQFSESRAWFARVLALDGGSVDQRASVANWASNHALCQGDFQAALALSEQARTMAAAACSNALMAISLDSWANILLDQCKLEQAAAVFQQERVLLLEEDSLGWLSACIDYREAAIALERGDHLEGERLCTSAMLALGQEPNVWIRLRVERAMGQVAFQRGDLDSAQARFEVVLNGTRQIHDLQGVIYALIDLAHVAQVRHRLPLARQRMRQALQAAEGHAEPLVQARAIEAAAALLAHARPEGTLQVLGATRRLRSSLGAPLWPLEGARVERALQVAHGRLGANAAGVAMASGEAVRPERAARIALDLLESLESSTPSSRPPHEVLTPREQDVAALVAQGLTNRAIAQALVISEGTVRAHVEHILNKLGARSRREIAERLQRGSPDGQVL